MKAIEFPLQLADDLSNGTTLLGGVPLRVGAAPGPRLDLLTLSLYGAMLGIPLATVGYVMSGTAHAATKHPWARVPRSYALGIAAELAVAGAGLAAAERIAGLAAPANRAAWTAGALAWVGHLWWGVVIARTQPVTPPPPTEADAIGGLHSQQPHSHDSAFC